MRKKILSLVFDFIEKYFILILIISLVLGILFFLAFKFIKLEADYINLLPPKSEPVVNIKKLTKKLRGVGQFSIVISSESKNIKKMQEVSDDFYNDIKEFPELQYIIYKIPVDFIKKNFFLFIETEDLEEILYRVKEKISYELWKDAPFAIDLIEDDVVEFNIDDIIDKYKKSTGGITALDSNYMISYDKEILIMFLKPDFMPTEVEKTGELLKKFNAISKKYNSNDINITFAGTYVLSYDQKNAIQNDIAWTAIIALIVIFIAILLFVRRFQFSVFLLYALGIGVLSAFGIAFIVLRHINLITGFLIAILTGLGVNYGIHFLLRFNEEYRDGSLINSLKTAFIRTGLASLTGALTTAISFFSLSFSRFLGFSEFGILASSGIIITLISTYTVVTAFIIFFNKFFKVSYNNQIINLHEQFDKFIPGDKNSKKIIFSISAVILFFTVTAGIAGFFILKNKNFEIFEYNSRKLEVKGQKSIKTTELIQEKFNISTDPAIFFTGNREEEIDFYKSVKKMLKKKDTWIGNVLSLSGVLNDEDTQKYKISILNEIKREFDTLPEKSIKDPDIIEKIDWFNELIKEINIVEEKDLPESFKRRFIAGKGSEKIYISQIFPDRILFDAKEMRSYVKEIRNIKGKSGEYHPTGMHILYVYLINTVLKESRIFFIIVFFIIWLLLLVDFKSIKDSLIAMIPLIFGVLWLIEIMVICGVKLNFMNIIVLPTILGTGVDNGVHIYHRYKESKNIFKAIYNTGTANFAMSLTVALGWSALFIAHYEGLKTMAFIGVTGILMTFIASVTIMPVVILLLEKTGKKNL